MTPPRDPSSRSTLRGPLDALWRLCAPQSCRTVVIPAALALLVMVLGIASWWSVAPGAEISPAVATREMISFLALDVILAGVVAALAYVQLNHTRRVEQIVEQRTAELERESSVSATTSRQLLRSQEMLTAAQAIAHIGHWDWDIAANEFVCSDEVYRILGLDPASHENYHPLRQGIVHPDDQHKHQIATSRALAGEQDYQIQIRIVRPDGSIRVVEEQGLITRSDNGSPLHMLGITHDVTDRVEAERALSHGTQRLEQAQRIAHVGHWEWDVVTNDLTWSDEIYRIFGLEPQQFGATYPAFLESIHPDDRQSVEDAVGRAVAGDEDYDIDHRVVRPNGEIRYVHESGTITWSNDGRPLHMLGVVNDITVRVEAEQALTQSNHYLNAVLNTVQATLLITDNDSNIVLANQAASDMLGYSIEELAQIDPIKFAHPNDLEAIAARRQERAQGIESSPNFRRRMVRKDGTAVWVESSPSLFRLDGEVAGLVAEYREITYQLATEEQLRESTSRLEVAQSVTHVGSWGQDLTEKRDRYWSDELYRLYGIEPGTIPHSATLYLDYLHPDDRDHFEACYRPFREALTDTYEVQARFIGADGIERVLLMKGERTRNEDNKPVRMDGTAQDVTAKVEAERQITQAQARIEENSNFLSTVFDTVQAALIISDADENIVTANQAAADMLGYTLEELKHIKPRTFVHPDDAAAIIERTRARAQGIESEPHFRRRMVRKDGSSVWVEATPSIFWLNGKIAGRVAEYRAITHQIEAEQQLHDSAERLELAQSMAHVGSWSRSLVTGERYWSDELCRLLGLEPGSTPPPTLYRDHLHPDDRDRFLTGFQAFRDALVDTYDLQARFIGVDGVQRTLRMQGERTYDEAGEPVRLDGYALDVTAQIEAERQLQESADRLELAQTMAKIGSWGRHLVNRDGYWSDEFCRLLGYEPGEVTASRTDYLNHLHPDDRERFTLELVAFRENISDTYDARARFVGADGVERVLQMHGERTRDEHGTPIRLDGTGQDITARVEAERQLETAQQRLTQELERAGEVQRALQPGISARFQMLSVAGLCLPAREVGGDFFDWAPFDDGGVRLTIGDVMGKGIPAAIFMSMTQTAIRASGRPDAHAGNGPAGQLSRVNRALFPYLDNAESFVTAFTAEIDRDGRISYADAGHGHALIRRHDGTVTNLHASGLPIGVAAGTTYVSATTQLESGDTLLLMTDGLRDLLDVNSDGQQWEDIISSAVSSWDDPQHTADEIVALAQATAPEDGLNDDLTIVVLSYEGTPAAPNTAETPTGALELTIPPNLSALATAEDDLQLFLRRLRVGEQRSGALLTAVHEILANIVEHAKPAVDVMLAIDVRDDAIVVTTCDDGRPFDARKAARSAETATDRGRGLAMCQILLDRTDYARINNQNQWQLEMQLTPTTPVTASSAAHLHK